MRHNYLTICLIGQSTILYPRMNKCDAFYNVGDGVIGFSNASISRHRILFQRGGAQELGKRKMSKKSKKKSNKNSKTNVVRDIKKTTEDANETRPHTIATKDSETISRIDDEDDNTIIMIDTAIGSSCIIHGSQDWLGDDSPTIVSKYFLNQHSYLYSLQCICSFLVLTFGIGSFSTKSNEVALLLTRRLMIFAGIKYLLGLIACGIALGSKIENIGLHETRIKVRELLINSHGKIEEFISGGISAHCLVYCIICLLWMPLNDVSAVGAFIEEEPLLRYILIAPIFLREVANVYFIGNEVTEFLKSNKLPTIGERFFCWHVNTSNQIAHIAIIAELLIGCCIILDQIKALHAVLLLGNHNNRKRTSAIDFIRVALCTRLYFIFITGKSFDRLDLKNSIENQVKKEQNQSKRKKTKRNT